MTNTEFVETAIRISGEKTLYALGAFGAPLNAKNKARYSKNNSYNKARASIINAASSDTFAFDCIGIIKSILWGFDFNANATYGGAKYKSNSVPDTNVDGMLKKCTDISTDFSTIEPGEYLWMRGHCGIYIGDGLAVECTPAWDNKVQITNVNGLNKSNKKKRQWLKHGKLKYVEYPIAPENLKPQKGETVRFNGSTHYTNANATNGKQCNPGYAVVKQIYRLGKSKHPYRIKGIKPCTANGWVDTEDIYTIDIIAIM